MITYTTVNGTNYQIRHINGKYYEIYIRDFDGSTCMKVHLEVLPQDTRFTEAERYQIAKRIELG